MFLLQTESLTNTSSHVFSVNLLLQHQKQHTQKTGFPHPATYEGNINTSSSRSSRVFINSCHTAVPPSLIGLFSSLFEHEVPVYRWLSVCEKEQQLLWLHEVKLFGAAPVMISVSLQSLWSEFTHKWGLFHHSAVLLKIYWPWWLP